MFETFSFGRFDKNSHHNDVRYVTKTGKDADFTQRDLHMDAKGAHWSVSVQNFMHQDLLVVNSLRSEPMVIPSVYTQDQVMFEDTENVIIIKLRMRETTVSKGFEIKTRTQTEIEIRCPGWILEKQSVFVEELGWYFTIPSRKDATIAQVVQDSKNTSAQSVSVPDSLVPTNPNLVFGDYAELTRYTLEHMSRIQVRVGIKTQGAPELVPDHIKGMTLVIADRVFSPYWSNHMIYDPSLGVDDFIIDNLHMHNTQSLRFSFSDLQTLYEQGLYVDTTLVETLNGNLCAFVIFPNEKSVADYFHTHVSQELYDKLSERIIVKSGSYSLEKKIHHLEQSLVKKEDYIAELSESLKFEQSQSKEFKRLATLAEETIKRIKENKEEKLSYGVVTAEMENARSKIFLDQYEMYQKRYMAETQNKASKLKAVAEIIKSSWGILLIMAGMIPFIVKGWNKLNSA